jgi:hypothetical protein
MAMAVEWQMIRVRRSTAAAIRAEADRLVEAASQGRMLPWWAGERPTMDELVVRLMAYRQGQRRRKAK